ncbi:olfactory receptor 2AP1-like [Alligator mississippiensis]|uniref:olfactory receptor 2AP1-like n=1 Tax=Alligator mississippiensis TaxID=8496 RepID=UPI002878011A|nr:olfactory receptor 2AP1-like [Alligator mississippiensis]
MQSVAHIGWSNQSSIMEFILLGFGNISEMQVPLFLMFLLVYLVTISGNILIVTLVVVDQHLHTPMYFFLGNLLCLETCYSSTILPRLLASLLSGDRTISVRDCFSQFYCFGVLGATECFLLAVMSYDRYLAICNPLHYAIIMNGRVCTQLAAYSWTGGLLSTTIVIILMSKLQFCTSNEIDHFFCDFSPIVKLSCNDTGLLELVIFTQSSIASLIPFLLTLTSYASIISTILRIPSTTGRQKAFSTCSSHLVIVTTFYGTLFLVYVVPKTYLSKSLRKVFSVFYTALTPMLNPLIYSLRNKGVKEDLRRALSKIYGFTRFPFITFNEMDINQPL